MIVFETQDAAESAKQMIESDPPARPTMRSRSKASRCERSVANA